MLLLLCNEMKDFDELIVLFVLVFICFIGVLSTGFLAIDYRYARDFLATDYCVKKCPNGFYKWNTNNYNKKIKCFCYGAKNENDCTPKR